MKKIFFIAICLFVIHSLSAQTHFSVELQNYYRKVREVSASGFLWASRNFEGKNSGVYAYALAGVGYGEVQVGRSQKFKLKHPGKFIQIGTSIGLDTEPSPLRVGAYIFCNVNRDSTGVSTKGQWQGAIAAEYGSVGYWYSGFITYNISNRVGVGFLAQALAGVWGPRIQYQQGPVLIYVSGGYGLETKDLGAITGLRCFF